MTLASPLPASDASVPPFRQCVGAEIRALWHLAWPILIGQLATIGTSVTSVSMAGHTSAQELAGVSLGISLYNMTILTLMGTVMSVNPLVAHHVGARQWSAVPALVRQGIWKALLLGLLAMGAINLAARVFGVMDIEPQVQSVGHDFVLISSLGLPAFTCYRVLYGYSTSINQTKPMMVIALATLALHLVLTYALVFGHLGLPALGGVGCAWSTLACVGFSLLALLGWMRWAPAYRSTWPFGQWQGPDLQVLGRLFRLGMPIGITHFAETSAFGLIALLVAKFGSTQVAAHTIALNFSSVTFMVPLSLGLALLTRVGHSLGAADPAAARFRAWVGLGFALTCALLCALAMAWFRQPIAHAYTDDAAVADLAALLLLFAALFQLSDCTQVVASCAIRGYRVTRAPMVLHMAAFWGFSLPLGCWLGLAWPLAPFAPLGAQGFWIALVVGLSVAAIGLVLMLRQVSAQALERAR